MKINELKPEPKDKYLFKISFYTYIPKYSGCYVLTTFENDILYIGMSRNLFLRFKQHLANQEKTKPTSAGKAVWFYYIEYNEYNLPQLERTWLNQYLSKYGHMPILNKIYSTIS